MKKEKEYSGFEQGIFRPPSEAHSLLLRVTRNCPWNRCTFCSLYKEKKFSLRPAEHVLKDIDTVQDYVRRLTALQHTAGRITLDDFKAFSREPGSNRRALHAARNFMKDGMSSVFLQDGNSLIIRPDDLVRILEHIRSAFPSVKRVTSYARSRTVARIPDEDMVRLARAGLNRIHIGMESGSDKVLKKVKKGVDKATHIIAGQKVGKAGIELSEYFMPGLGGRSLSMDNARETADALNRINPDFIRLRPLALSPGSPLAEEYDAGEFDKAGDVETAEELLMMLESLEGITSTICSDHVLNLLPEVDGTLPEDKEKLCAPIHRFLALPPGEQMLYRIGRRTGCMQRLDDLNNPKQRDAAMHTAEKLGADEDNADRITDRIMREFI